ncbi:hypothetical protein [Parasphingorhabdus sp.]|uniref:hypothetical protein n=1 Tax=Parasphingorhabdus sp. TaxID=2709688 RepID=UPI0007F4D4F2|nr:hypothetical protein A8B75_16200 [Sphingomonadales bacterium EhC05]
MKRFVLPIFLASLVFTTPVHAQNSGVDKRVDRLEQEMRAVQRKVFPGGSSRFFEPEIAPESAPSSAPASTTTSAVTDLIARVDALENSLASLTGQVEQNGFRLKKIEDQLAAAAAMDEPAPATVEGEAVPSSTTEPAQATADPTRVEAVAAIVMPDTGDAGEDAYIYGFRLWEAKFYLEAQDQLKKVIAAHPNHRRTSFAQNLLGRAYLDDGKPALASQALYANYQKLPRGERASDSLYFLSVALVELDKKDEACRVLSELQEVYPEIAEGRLSARVSRGKSAANCK